jgi:hypothetical protein
MVFGKIVVHHHLTLPAAVALCQEKLGMIFVPDEQIERSIKSIPPDQWGVFIYGQGTGPDFAIAESDRFDKWFGKLCQNPNLTFWGVTPAQQGTYGAVYPTAVTSQ